MAGTLYGPWDLGASYPGSTLAAAVGGLSTRVDVAETAVARLRAASAEIWSSVDRYNLQAWPWGTESRLSVVVLGDSITEGSSAAVPETEGYAFRLAQALHREFGDGGRGFYGPWKSQVTRTGGWVQAANNGAFDECYYAPSDSTQTVTLTGVVGDTLSVLYVDGPSGGDPAVAVDGGAPTTPVIAKTGDLAVKAVTVSLGALGTHTVVIRHPAVGNFFFVGAAVYKGTAGAVVHNVGKASTYAGLMTGARMRLVTALAPRLTIVNFVTNDCFYQVPLATYSANLSDIVTQAKALGDVLVLIPPRRSDAGVIPITSYEATAKAVAVAAAVPWASFADLFGDAYDAARMADNVHPNTKGHTDMAKALVHLLRAA